MRNFVTAKNEQDLHRALLVTANIYRWHEWSVTAKRKAREKHTQNTEEENDAMHVVGIVSEAQGNRKGKV